MKPLRNVFALFISLLSCSICFAQCPNPPASSDTGHFTYGGRDTVNGNKWKFMDGSFVPGTAGVTVFNIDGHERELLLAWMAVLTNSAFENTTNWCASTRENLHEWLHLTYGTLDAIRSAADNIANPGAGGVQTAFNRLAGTGLYDPTGGLCPKDITRITNLGPLTNPSDTDITQPVKGEPVMTVTEYHTWLNSWNKAGQRQ